MFSQLVRPIRKWGWIVLLPFVTVSPAFPTVETFDGVPAGTIVAGEDLGGEAASGDIFPMMTLSVINNGGGPHCLIIFDSSNPTGCDFDLGTPNQSFGGPGIGRGGAPGSRGENRTAYGHLLIVAEDIIDAQPADGLVDDPDDEAGGGVVQIDFVGPMIVHGIVLVDIDRCEWATIDCYLEDAHVGVAAAEALGNNSVQGIDLSSYGPLTRISVTLSSSGAIAEINFTEPVPVDENTWGMIKQIYR